MEAMESVKNHCPDEETLLAYGLGLVDESEDAAVEGHLYSCDACVLALALATQRLRQMEASRVEAVPPHIAEKVAATPHRAAAASAGGASAQRWRRVRLPIPPRQVWPLALAAGLVLAIGLHLGNFRSPSEPERLTRSIPENQFAKVSASVATVRREPHPRAEVVATLRRGDAVRIGTQQREWYRVSLPDGTEGWVEQDAFR